ncbi:MAG: hypothetical protein R3B45_09585 [Bdellovibrionota bacterium]
MLYATSRSDNCWEIIMPFLIDHGIDTKRKRTHQIRSIVDACFYIVDNGTKCETFFIFKFNFGLNSAGKMIGLVSSALKSKIR